MKHKCWYNKRKALYSLQEDDVFSSEELDLLMQRINEELEYASSDILRVWEKESKNNKHTDY
ncbi:MAG: hypothetical protein WCS59_05190 [Sphaerochaetaceae bacterium]|jgi:hypothetical protein|nr:hypothetical protein [Sphaerochaetaceae bacterium]MDY0372107.1 hypothetical protein [Sphaerochaetaceae bacterium]